MATAHRPNAPLADRILAHAAINQLDLFKQSVHANPDIPVLAMDATVAR